MKLLRASFVNFRLLKDLTLDFSTDADKPLTVIRAANETGKTTCQYGLMWALYGSKEALPRRGDYSLFPADLKSEGVKKVEVSVEIEFVVDSVVSTGRGTSEIESKTYRLIRSCMEYPGDGSSQSRDAERVQMSLVTPSGTEIVPENEMQAIIAAGLPAALKDVYFTDGDSAMTFIEAAATAGVKRKRVSGAIESLLGIEILKATGSHLNQVAKKFSGEIDNTDYQAELEKLNDQIDGHQEDIAEWNLELSEFESQATEGAQRLKTLKAQIEDALKQGDKEQLAKRLASVEADKRRLISNADTHLNQLARLVSSEDVSKIFVSDMAIAAKELLAKQHQDKKLPKADIPILEELLAREDCFCGSDLSQDTEPGRARRSLIEKTIEDSAEMDKIQEEATSLYYRSTSESYDGIAPAWKREYASTQGAYQNVRQSLSEKESESQSLDETIRHLDDSMVTELKEQEGVVAEKLSRLRTSLGMTEQKIQDASERLAEAQKDLSKVEKKLGRTNTSASKLTLARLAQKVFEGVVERLKGEELRRVSEEMNRIFLEMIGSDPEGNDLTLITRAELTEEYDIVVYGPDGHQLDPDQDLNGASRRAITLAFILALTKVSEVEAPNVIDTPLGMMSGFVKQSVLLQTIREGSQVVLFLTHDEIKGVEHILDQYAGLVYTLTNPAHYPKILKNQPEVSDARILRCACDHKASCSICARKDLEVA